MKKILVLLLMSTLSIHSKDLAVVWSEAQEIYKELKHVFQNVQNEYDAQCLIPGWCAFQAQFEALVLGHVQPLFLHNSAVKGTMLREGFGPWQKHELNYIKNSLSVEHKNLVYSYQDTTIGGLPLNMPEIGCAANSLGQLYVFSRILNQGFKGCPDSVLEWGGGFGSLARVVKQLAPESTYFIVDLLPLLALQYIYLHTSLPNTPIKVHYFVPEMFESGYIHLIPFYLASELHITVDAFISAFALTECPFATQKIVSDKNFFNASALYISGITGELLDVEGRRLSSFDQSLFMKTIAPIFQEYSFFGHYIEGHYELLAKK